MFVSLKYIKKQVVAPESALEVLNGLVVSGHSDFDNQKIIVIIIIFLLLLNIFTNL